MKAMKKTHVNLFFHLHAGGQGKKWDSYKMEVAFGKGGIYLLRKFIGKGSSY
jgi:hypothetical protein